ncbi:hypothetical protein [Shinella sp.]|uniref:hypothetical protein n=1 Tax=Shinella sp. TaxID=1870904 RepID=UPI0028B174F1|nr:hypothetical protein [Shinella sp.]
MLEWQPIETAPRDGTNIYAFAPGYGWPEVIRWEDFDAADAAETGEPGYWRYSEGLMADVCVLEFETLTHWAKIVLPVIA